MHQEEAGKNEATQEGRALSKEARRKGNTIHIPRRIGDKRTTMNAIIKEAW